MPFLEPVTLTGELVTLEPLQVEHHDELVEAASDGRLWELWYTSVPTPDTMAADIDERLARQQDGTMLPFATHVLVYAAVGCTALFFVGTRMRHGPEVADS